MKITRQRILYRGNVQGVGFRATCQQIARQYAVTGYVCNLPDGDVELMVQGERTELAALQAEVRARMGDNIVSERAGDRANNENFKSFEIRY